MNLRKNRRNSRKKQRRLQTNLTEVQAKLEKAKGWRGCPPWGRATGAAPAKRRLRRYYYKQRRTDRRFCGWRHTSCGDPAVWSSSELWFSACCRNCNIKPCGKSSFSEYDQRSYLCKRNSLNRYGQVVLTLFWRKVRPQLTYVWAFDSNVHLRRSDIRSLYTVVWAFIDCTLTYV